MNVQIMIVLVMTFIITIIGTLAYSTRIVGIRTGRIAVSLSLFNIFVLISRIAANLQTPVLTKYVENGHVANISSVFNLILLAAGLATVVGALLIPTFQRLFYKAVKAFSVSHSIPRLILHSFSTSGIRHFKDSIKIPSKGNITKMDFRNLPFKY